MDTGSYGVVVNEPHFKDLLFECVPPPASSVQPSATKATPGADLMQMGFPTMSTSRQYPTLCSCHSKLRSCGFICPRCKSQVCEIPTECPVCALTIVSSPHLARSYRHLFPVKNFIEVSLSVLSILCLIQTHDERHLTDLYKRTFQRNVIPALTHSKKSPSHLKKHLHQRKNKLYQLPVDTPVLHARSTFVWIAIRSYMMFWLFVLGVIEKL